MSIMALEPSRLDGPVLTCRRGARLSAGRYTDGANSSSFLVLGVARTLGVRRAQPAVSTPLKNCGAGVSGCFFERPVVIRGVPVRNSARAAARRRSATRESTPERPATSAHFVAFIGARRPGAIRTSESWANIPSLRRSRSTGGITSGCTRRTGPARARPVFPRCGRIVTARGAGEPDRSADGYRYTSRR